MKVILAGYNLDTEVIEALKRGEKGLSNVTPEVLSASYARISRDPRAIDELRAAARNEVEKARRSNSNIIFKMGHHSVAEHAVFNFDIIDVSRLAMEELERFRLCSYTEKSQRYQTLEGSCLVPEEIEQAGLEKLFTETVTIQNECYAAMVSRDVPPEDARYITSLSTPGQTGMTLNARNLELLFRRFASSPFNEVREIGLRMYEAVKDIAPSIILFTDPTPLDRETYPELRKKTLGAKGLGADGEINLVDHTKDADDMVLAALMITSTNLSHKECSEAVKAMSSEQKEELIKTSLKNLEFYDHPLREFEFADMTFELIVSAACFGQLKRHRMATIVSQEYDPSLGITVPRTVKESPAMESFAETIKRTEEAFARIAEKAPLAARYLLTNAHRKRVLFKCNARELYHISRLREDRHAQWDIQDVSAKMTALAKIAMPLTMLTIGGKDSYPGIYEKVFGRRPKMTPVY